MKIQFRLATAAFITLTCIVASPRTGRAELPPQVYEEMRAKAPEVVEIEVTRVALNQRDRNDLRDISVYADAKITGVTRSKSRLKVGDKISLRYLTFEVITPGRVGPGPIQTVKVGKRYQMWLKKSGAYFYAAARKQSVEEK